MQLGPVKVVSQVIHKSQGTGVIRSHSATYSGIAIGPSKQWGTDIILKSSPGLGLGDSRGGASKLRGGASEVIGVNTGLAGS